FSKDLQIVYNYALSLHDALPILMGMAPYGVPRYQDKVWKLVDAGSDGAFALNLDYFSFHYSPTRTYTSKFEGLFGKPRSAETPLDRKSTRLNSSHDQISYAVFCL